MAKKIVLCDTDVLIDYSDNNQDRHRRTKEILENEISRISVDLIKKYNLSHGLAIPDSLIAATALVASIELFTFNTKDYRFIKGLKLYNPDAQL